MKPLIGLFILFIITLYSCEPLAQEYLNKMNSEADFQALQREPLSAKYAEVQAVKLVYDIQEKQIYYISNSFEYHNNFCKSILGYPELLGIFNRDNYGTDSSKRSYLLANINYFSSRNEYILELSPSDHMLIGDIEFLHNKIIETSFLEKDMSFILNSYRLIEDASKFSIPTVTSEDIYQHQEFQAVSKYSGIGKLKKVRISELDSIKLNPDDLIILDGTPLQLAAVAGIITSDLQTPLSHLSILGQNRKIPVMAYKHAWDDEQINSLLGEYVILNVTDEGYSIEKTEKPDTTIKDKKRKHLKKDLSVTTLIKAKDFDRKTSNYCGYKAENFGVLAKLSSSMNFSIPEAAFGIPFHFYDEHKRKSGAEELINKLNSSDNPEPLLAEIRARLLQTPIDPDLLSSITNQVIDMSSFRRMRFRSSTNAEDMKGFSGAGLYTSKTGIINDEVKTVEIALQKVWASLWNDAAFYEREYFNFNHEDAMMGVLVHRSFPDEEVNGVVITKNIYRVNNLGFVVNAQLGETSVVQPDPNITCDQFICYPTEKTGFYSQNETIEIITTSSLNENKLVMSKDEIIDLANVLNEIKKYFYYRDFTSKTFNEFGLDFEFKLEKDSRALYLKQVRPYNY